MIMQTLLYFLLTNSNIAARSESEQRKLPRSPKDPVSGKSSGAALRKREESLLADQEMYMYILPVRRPATAKKASNSNCHEVQVPKDPVSGKRSG